MGWWGQYQIGWNQSFQINIIDGKVSRAGSSNVLLVEHKNIAVGRRGDLQLRIRKREEPYHVFCRKLSIDRNFSSRREANLFRLKHHREHGTFLQIAVFTGDTVTISLRMDTLTGVMSSLSFCSLLQMPSRLAIGNHFADLVQLRDNIVDTVCEPTRVAVVILHTPMLVSHSGSSWNA
jgi:hypothetical protein